MKFIPQLRSQHPSHSHLRRTLTPQPFRAVIRLGSKTTTQECFPDKTEAQRNRVVEINTVRSIQNSSDKLAMKNCFVTGQVKTADWFTLIQKPSGLVVRTIVEKDYTNTTNLALLPYPIIAKHRFGSRGTGNHKLDTQAQLEAWLRGKDTSNYIFEKFYNFSREYRLHVTKDGCFYTNRKLRRNGTPDNQRWFFNDSNSNWILEDNQLFDKPTNWTAIVAECVKALRSTGLDIGGFDVKVQSRLDSRNRTRQNPDFIIIESNSACSHGDITAVKYREELNRLLNEQATNYIQGAEEKVLSRGTNNSNGGTQLKRSIIKKKLIRR